MGLLLSRVSRVLAIVLLSAVLVAVPDRRAVGAPASRIEWVDVPSLAAAADLPAGADPPARRVALPFDTSHIGASWAGSEDAVVEVRTQSSTGSWSAWRLLEVAHDLTDGRPDGRTVSGLVTVAAGQSGPAAAAEVRAAGGAQDVRLAAIDTVYGPRRDAPASASAQTIPTSPTSTTTSTTTLARPTQVPQPPIVSRAQWGADESIRKGPPKHAPIGKMIVHHTVTENADPDPAATVRAIYAYHVQGNGWDDIGYNFLIDAQGRVYEGRYARTYGAGELPTGEDEQGRGVIGAHAEGTNTGSVGIALLGTFTNGRPTQAAVDALTRLLAWKADRHDIDPRASDGYVNPDGSVRTFPNIAGHRDVKSTVCPGDLLYDQLPAIRAAVDNQIQSAGSAVTGYWVATRDGRVLPYGQATDHGSMAGRATNAAFAGLAPTPSGRGYWQLGGDGGIFAFGDAGFFGSTGGLRLNKPVIALAPTRSGRGYWLLASDGGIFSFGDARFHGSTGAMRLNAPVVGMAPTPSGGGYWLVASDGGIFSFGDARFRGSTGSLKLNSPVVGMAAEPDGSGYWLVARDGGIFAFDAPFHGSIPGMRVQNYPGTAVLRSTHTGRGYYVQSVDGSIHTFGDARHLGNPTGLAAGRVAVDLAILPAQQGTAR